MNNFFHLRRLRQVRRLLGRDVTVNLVAAFVLSRLDYCNALLAGLPYVTIAPLQRVINAAVRLIYGLRPRNHVSAAAIELHWLPIEYRQQYKIEPVRIRHDQSRFWPILRFFDI